MLITGGGARSRLWREIVSATLALSVISTAEDQLGILGAVKLAAQSIGASNPVFSDDDHYEDRIDQPADPDVRAAIDTGYRRYKSLVEATVAMPGS